MNSQRLKLDGPDCSAHVPSPELKTLWKEAGELWDEFENQHQFHEFVAADYEQVYQALRELRNRAFTFLEWGSGLGVITIMASTLGFDAYGIETQPHLVELSRSLAKKYGPEARFAEGSFIPSQYEWDPVHGDETFRTVLDAEPGYEELDMELRDFDLVYAYPWPHEHPFFQDIMRECGGRKSLFLSYDVREGIAVHRLGANR